MPSFLGRFLGLSFRTELLIMNLVGLVNSTLDWSPLKWTNKLEQIWNLSISDSSLILDTIGEDTIKTILSWIVITRIVIAHVFTITYVTNFYPIVTWSRPNLLLPWLLLSFFKNVFLEVIVIVIGLLLWYGRPFSLVVFLEFIFVKLIPLVLASYNWYSNSCLFLQLRYTERMRTLKRSMRSDSNLLTNQIYLRIEDRYRTGSLTSLFSYSSYDTYDANLSLSDNAKKLFGLTEQDILEARVRIKERAAYRRLTELDDDYFFGNSRMNLNEHLFFGSRHNQSNRFLLPMPEILASNPKDLENSENENINNPLTVENLENIDNPAVVENLESIEEETVTGADATTEVLKNKEEVTDMVDTLIISSLSTVEDNALMRQNETTGIGPTTENVKSVERSSSPVKMQTLFNCNCAMDDFKEGQVGCCSIVDMRTSTPKKSPDDVNKDNDSVDHSKKTSVQRYTYAYNVTNVTNDFVLNTSFPLMEKLLMNDLEILKSFNTEEQNAGKKIVPEDTSARELRKIQDDQPNIFLNDYGRYRNVSTEAQDLSDIVKDMTVTLQAMTQLEAERDDKAIGEPRNVVMQTVMVSKATVDGGVIHSQNSSSQSRAQDTEKSVTKSNLPERSFDEMNIPRFYKDSMKVFDGCYEKDFANNVELQCLLQQMEKKKWNLFTGQTDVETSPTVLAKQNNEINANFKTDPGKIEEIPESTTLRSIPKEDKVPFQKVKAIDEPEPEPPRKIINPSKPVHVKLTRDSYTQVDEMERKDSTNSLDEAKRRRKQFFKRKWLKEQSRSVSPVGSVKLHPMKNDSRGPKNDCECKMQRLEAKYCASSDSTFNKKEESRKVLVKSRIDSLATLPLSQVTKQPESDTAAFRKKPPVYPKKPKKDTQTIVPNATSRKPPVNKRPEVVEPKRSMNRQFTNSTKVAKSKGRTNAAIDEEEALEMRYLKAYNEITLFKDKKELEAKKRTPRDTVVRAGQFRHFYSRKTDLRKDSLTSSAKENLSVDAATDVDPALVMSSKGNKPPMNAPGRSGSVSNDKHPCSKLSKVNKATDRLLDNFDRLYGSQTNKDVKRSRIIPDLDTRKQYTKYSRTRKLAEEEILSTNSSKKLEGTQKGRELERTPAEEDMRNRVEPTGAAILEIATEAPPQRRENAVELSVRDDCRNETAVVHAASIETEDKKLLTLVERFMKGNGATTWSSSSVEQGEEIPATVTEITNTEDQAEGSPKAEEERMEGSNVITPTLSTSLQSSRLDKNIEYTQFSSISDEMIDQRAGTSQDHPRASRKPDLTDLARNTEVSYVTDGTPGVILTNQNSQGSKNRPMDIVDARTGRMLHNAMSYSSMDSFLDFPSEVRTVEEIIRDTRVESSSNEFVCRVSNEAIFDDEFPAISRQANQLDNVLATIQEVQDLCIITIHRNDLPVDPELEISCSFGDIEDNRGSLLSDSQLENVLTTVTEALRTLTIEELDLETITGQAEETSQIELVEMGIGDEEEPVGGKMVGDEDIPRFIKEDIITNIKFPIVIKKSDLDSKCFSSLSDFPLQLVTNSVIGFVKLVGTNLHPLFKKMEGGEKKKVEEGKGLQELKTKSISMVGETSGYSSEFSSIGNGSFNENDGDDGLDDEEWNGDTFEEFKMASDETCPSSFDLEILSTIGSVESSLDSSKLMEVSWTTPMREINKTFDIIKAADLNEIDDGGVRIEEIDENVKRDTEENVKVEEIDGNIKFEQAEGTFKHAEVEESIKCPNSEKKISIEESGNNLTLEENKANLDVREIKGSTDIKKDERNVHDGVDVKIQEFLEGKDIKDQEESIRTEQIERSCPRKTEKIIKIEESSEISRNEEEEKFDVNIEYQTAEDHVIIEKTECSIELKNIKSISKYEKEADINYQDVEESIIVEETEENTRDEEPRSNNTVEQVEEIIQILDTRRKEASINADRFEETEENIEISDSVWEESNLTIEGTNEVSKLESNFDKLEIVEHNEVSLKIILVFLLNVLYFYIRYICQEIYSFAQISRATTTLKPFEVHTVSTSTSTLLEKAELLEKIEHETLLEEDEEFFESSVDFENVDVFRSIDQRLQIVQDLASDRSTSRDSEFHNEEMAENLRKETEELGLNSSGYVTVEVSLLNKTDEKGVERFDVRDRFNDNVRKEKEENKLENRPAEQTTKSPFSNQGGTGHNDVNSGKSFLKQKSFSTSELEERKAIDLHAADEDVECGSSMSLLQDRVSSEKSQLNILKATLKIGEDMAEIQRNIKKRELDLMIIERSEEKTSEKESIEESKQESIEESKQDSIENSKEVPIGESKEVWIEELKEVSTEKSEEVSIGESKEVSIEESKQESIVEENTSNKANSGDATISSENYEESSSVHFDTTLDEMDSFNSIYTRASETPIVISFSELDNDDMEEFSIASNASNEAA